MSFNEKLTKLRKEKGMTQEELAFKVGVSRQSVSKWELGDCEPDIAKLKEIAKIFNVSTDYLLFDDITTSENSNTNKVINKIAIIKVLPAILVLIGGIGLIASLILVFLFPHYTPSCGGKGSTIIKYFILDWCNEAVIWRFGLFIPSIFCFVLSIIFFIKERKSQYEK